MNADRPVMLWRSLSTPWKTSMTVGLGLALVVAGCAREPALLHQAQKAGLVEALRAELLASAEAEKSAVMAVTDEESEAFAAESRARAQTLDRLRNELRERVVAEGRARELEKLAAFDAAWVELRDVDERLLRLAVANSNLKAARLAAGESAQALDRFVDGVAQAGAERTDPIVLRRLSAASVAALRVQTLLAPHIASPDDAEMTELETRMRELAAQVEAALADAGAQAAAAWRDYERLVAEVIRLSRLNTNVVSVDVSLHEKRQVLEKCRAALQSLLEEIDSVPRPTR